MSKYEWYRLTPPTVLLGSSIAPQRSTNAARRGTPRPAFRLQSGKITDCEKRITLICRPLYKQSRPSQRREMTWRQWSWAKGRLKLDGEGQRAREREGSAGCYRHGFESPEATRASGILERVRIMQDIEGRKHWLKDGVCKLSHLIVVRLRSHPHLQPSTCTT